jgi:hypothetical protein
VALAACVWFLLKLGRNRNGESRSARLMEKYKTLTPDLLAETPDEELVEAVVACVLAEAADSRRPDPAYTLSKWVQPYTVVYSIWAVCKEMANGTYAALKRTATREMVEHACDGLPVVGAPDTAAALKAVVEAHKAGEDTAALESDFHAAVEQECPLTLCVDYIRDHIPALLGDELEEDLPELPEAEEVDDEA